MKLATTLMANVTKYPPITTKRKVSIMPTLTNGTFVPVHYNDRFYEANCPECNEEVSALTHSDIVEILDIHC